MLTHIEVSKANLLHNFSQLKQTVKPGTIIVSVVKGNAYGHGITETVQILKDVTDWFGVISIEDIRAVRAYSDKPVMVLGYLADEDLEEAVKLDTIFDVYSIDRLERLNSIGLKCNKNIAVHLKIDALLGRQGFLVSELKQVLERLPSLPRIQLEGIYAHFANIEDTRDFSHAQKQIDTFQAAKDLVKAHGYFIHTHISSTAGSLVYEKIKHENDIVRFGIGLYGMWPSHYLQSDMEHNMELKPVMRWLSKIAQVKTLPAEHPIGYGLTYTTSKDTRIAVVPVGYYDGYDRGLSNKGEVLISGTRCKVIGRVAMNMIVVDISHLKDVHVEDDVVLLGTQGDEIVTAEEIAKHIDTINYEVTTRINPLLSRQVI